MSSLFYRLITLATCSWLPNRLHNFPALIDLVYKSYSMALRTLDTIKCNSIGRYLRFWNRANGNRIGMLLLRLVEILKLSNWCHFITYAAYKIIEYFTFPIFTYQTISHSILNFRVSILHNSVKPFSSTVRILNGLWANIFSQAGSFMSTPKLPAILHF